MANLIGLRTKAVMALSGLSSRQLQWWDEHGIVCPRKDRHSRVYTERQAVEILVLAELKRQGMSLQAIRGVLPSVRRQLAGYEKAAALDLYQVYLLVEGKRASIEYNDNAVVEAVLESRCRVYVVNLWRIKREVKAASR